MDSISNTDRHPPKKQSKLWLLLGVTFVVLACLSGTILFVLMRTAYLQSPRAVTISSPAEPGELVYTLSQPQQQTVDQLGYPDAFTIYFYQAHLEAGSDQGSRFETWSYYEEGLMFTFMDGEQVSQVTIPVLPDKFLPLPYQPEQFSTFMSLDRLKISTGIKEYVIQPIEPEIVQGAQVMYAEQLAFGMKYDRLVYVEALALTEE
jgi:hypothetical protein